MLRSCTSSMQLLKKALEVDCFSNFLGDAIKLYGDLHEISNLIDASVLSRSSAWAGDAISATSSGGDHRGRV